MFFRLPAAAVLNFRQLLFLSLALKYATERKSPVYRHEFIGHQRKCVQQAMHS